MLNFCKWCLIIGLVIFFIFFILQIIIGLLGKSRSNFDYRMFFKVNLVGILSHFSLLVFCILAVKLRFYFDVDQSDNSLMYFNDNPIEYSTVFELNTFLFGIILTFDMHYYDQIEPKYDLDNQTEYEFNKMIYKRTFFLIKMFVIITMNVLSTVFNLTWIKLSWYTPTEMLATTLYINFFFVSTDFIMYQLMLWWNRIKQDIDNS